MKFPKILALLSLLLLFSIQTFAYDKTGHRIIAQIATWNLKPEATKQVESLLGKNGLVNYANWADEMRSNHKYDYANHWHYFNVDGDFSSSQLDSVYRKALLSGDNLLWAIDSLSKVLKKDRNDTTALRFLIHFMGDLHQPLHFGKSTDRGGNQVPVKWFDAQVNLHMLWDTQMVNMEQLSYSEYSRFLTELYEKNGAKSTGFDMLSSFGESYKVSRKAYAWDYSNVKAYDYYSAFSPDLKRLLYLGGNQLAALMNEIFG